MSTTRFLIVDDSRSARFALRQVLGQFDVDIDEAASADEAIERIKANPPRVVLLDYMMPDRDGLEALADIRKLEVGRNIPVFMCSSADSKTFWVRARELGANGVLPKPPQPEHLRRIVIALSQQRGAQAPKPAATPQPAARPAAPPPAAPTPAAASPPTQDPALSQRLEKIEARLLSLSERLEKLDRQQQELARAGGGADKFLDQLIEALDQMRKTPR